MTERPLKSEDSAGVRFPPPFIYAGAFLLGLGLHRLAPVDSLPPSWRAVEEPAGLLIAAIGLLLAFTAIGLFLGARTHIIPHLPAKVLIVRGPYRWTRNPMYLSLALAYIGVALVFDVLWPLVLLPPALVVMQRHVITREERYLAARFGAAYEAYRQRVPRWLGRSHRE